MPSNDPARIVTNRVARFEVIVGKSIPETEAAKRIAFVNELIPLYAQALAD